MERTTATAVVDQLNERGMGAAVGPLGQYCFPGAYQQATLSGPSVIDNHDGWQVVERTQRGRQVR